MTKEDIIFTAGFFVGEGHVSIHIDKSGNLNGVISVNQSDREPLERLQQLWGGSIRLSTAHGEPSVWRWQCNSKLALPCLEAILPIVRNWSAFNVERIEKYITFWAINSSKRRERLRIIAWFQTNVKRHRKACHEKLEAAWLLKKEEARRAL